MALVGTYKATEVGNSVGADVENAYFFIDQRLKGNIKYDYPNNTLIAEFTVKTNEASRQAEKDCDFKHNYVQLGTMSITLPIPDRTLVDLKSKSAVTTYIYKEISKIAEYSNMKSV